MKKTTYSILISISVMGICSSALAAGSHSRKGHIRKDGTYVAPSRATNPDKTRTNNYSHKGNTNPYNGKRGAKP